MPAAAPLFLVLLACARNGAATAALPDSDAAAIRRTYQALTAAGQTEEYRRLGRFFTEDAVWMPPGGPAVQGRAAVQAWFTVRAKKWDVRILEVEGRGDLAYSRSAYALDLDVPNFRPVTGKSLEVWRKQADGSWLLARMSLSSDAP
jgi:ketosteroid isomerase-like protein